ncbi:MAG TPA: biotin carboxylase N-terminal domain-containing protein [Streptosporangiaceae bacterium]|nr:biotin carboxylase N-terminal domain-containing protein [Streptosporangiaceae bacterium]
MFDTVLIANRGEIAVRIIRTLRGLGIRSVAVYSDADSGSPHVRAADVAIRLGPAPAAESYLHAGRILAAAAQAGATAVHPGYGFLAENAAFARDCARAGLVFIGPPPAAIEAMGDKIAAKAIVAAAGVPVVPGAGAPGMADDELAVAAAGIGFPVLVKPSAGGGGKGMRLVRSAAELLPALEGARREARAAFGDGTLLIERYVERPRHVEIQVFADGHGNVIHLGERECSLQRRHQKIIEEAPSPLLDDRRRAAMGDAAVQTARSVGYVGAGTVEFIVSGQAPDDFYFLEMNTRLQVEHPVTELVTGLDLVELQVRVAAGQMLPVRQDQVLLTGHAVEARVYAEDPARGFLPAGGAVLVLREPALPQVRVDSGLAEGMTVSSAYDPMLAKVIAHGPDRQAALRRLDGALASMAVLGVTTNIAFLRTLLRHPEVAAGRLDTGLAERILPSLPGPGVPDEVLAAAALAHLLRKEPPGRPRSPWDIPDGWRVGGHAWTTVRLTRDTGEPVPVRIRGRAVACAEVCVGSADPVTAHAVFDAGALVVTYQGRTQRYAYAHTDAATGRGTTWLGRDGQAWVLAEEEPTASGVAGGGAGDGVVRSPMPGTVAAVKTARGDRVRSGEPLLIVEAMKMEHTVIAPVDGVVGELTAAVGQRVGLDEVLAVITPDAEPA